MKKQLSILAMEEPIPEEHVGEKKEKITSKELRVEDLPGVGAATAEKLADAGYKDAISIAVAGPAEIATLTGMSETVARKMINTARAKLDMGFESGIDLLEKREHILRISTGSSELDKLFGGGIESGGITECYGQYGAGKSALAHQLAVNVQLSKEQGGVDGSAVWVDTENTFRPERVKQIAEAQGLDPVQILKNIKVARCFNSDHQMLILDKIDDLVLQEKVPVKLVIVDSLMSLFRTDYTGRGQLADRQQKLNKHVKQLLKLSMKHNIVVYVTNQVMSKPDTFFGDPNEPIGGHVVGHGMTTRTYLRKGKKGTRVAKMVDSPYLPEEEAIFRITEAGIRNAE